MRLLVILLFSSLYALFFSAHPAFSQQKDTINLYFAINQYQLNTDHRVELNRLLDLFSEVTYVSISGHADTTGKPEYNMQLSRKRAVSVKNYLFEIGLDTLIRDFNYFGESKAIMPVDHGGNTFSKGVQVLSDRRVETITGGQLIAVNPGIPVPFSHAVTGTIVPNDNIPPEIKPVINSANNSVEPVIPLVHSKLTNGVELSYPKKTFPDFIENKMDHGDQTLIYLVDDLNALKQFKMLTVTEDNKFISPAEVVCFDSLSFTHLQKDTAVVIKIPLKNKMDCPEAAIKLFTAVSNNGMWKWQEQTGDNFTVDKNDGWYYASVPVKSFHGCMNFAYEIQSPCFSPKVSTLKLKNITLSQIQAFIPDINSFYIPAKKEEDTYEIFSNQKDASQLFFDLVARDNKNKIYNLNNFPVSMCRYDAEKNTYLLTKKDLQRFIKLR